MINIFRSIETKDASGQIIGTNRKDGLFHGKHPITKQFPGLESDAVGKHRRGVMLYAYGSPTGDEPWVPNKRKFHVRSRYSGKNWGSPYVHIEV